MSWLFLKPGFYEGLGQFLQTQDISSDYVYFFVKFVPCEYCFHWTIFPSCKSLHSLDIFRLLYVFTCLIISKFSVVYINSLWSCLSLLLFSTFLTICRCNSWGSLGDQQRFWLCHVTKHGWHFSVTRLIYTLSTQAFWVSGVLPSPKWTMYDTEDPGSLSSAHTALMV